MQIQVPDVKKTNHKNANRKAISALLSVLTVLIIGAAVVGILLSMRIKSSGYESLFNNPKIIITENTEGQANPDSIATPVFKTISYNGKTYMRNEGVVNLLFLGIDSDAVRRKNNKGYRSDMVMVCAVDTVEETATLISIPRDTYTTMYKIDSSGAIKSTVQAKINAAYAYGGSKEYRPANSMNCVQMFLQRECELTEPLGFTLEIPVGFYASIDMDGITKVASAVGGVEVKLDANIPGVGGKGETVLLKGSAAEEYIRNRHDTAGGDITRAARQRTFMIALAKKIKNMGEVNIILSLYDELQKYVNTNLNTDNMLDFAKLLKKVKIDEIRQISIPGESKRIDGSSVIIHDEKETLELLLDVYYKEA